MSKPFPARCVGSSLVARLRLAGRRGARPGVQVLRVLSCLAVLMLGLARPAESMAAVVPPAALTELRELAQDDPRAAVVKAEALLVGTADQEERFWRMLDLAEIYGMLEQLDNEARTIDHATAVLRELPDDQGAKAAWLESASLMSALIRNDSVEARSRMVRLREQVKRFDIPLLRCNVANTQMYVMLAVKSDDEAWQAAEELERCGLAVGRSDYLVYALINMGQLAARFSGDSPKKRPQDYFDRAKVALGDHGKRFDRSVLTFTAARANQLLGHSDDALHFYHEALELSRSIADAAGVAAAQVGIAQVLLDLGKFEAMLGPLDEAERLLPQVGRPSRMAVALKLKIQALTRLKRPEVLGVVERARQLDHDGQSPGYRGPLVLAMAEGQASQGHYQEAYATQERGRRLEEQARNAAQLEQLAQLQARYEAAQRDAENAELRHKNTTSQLEVNALNARQTGLWAVLSALALLTVGAVFFGRRELGRRNELQTAKSAADEANRAKSRFLAAASHDLRQPMHALSLYLGMLSVSQLLPRDVGYLSRARACATTMDEMFRAFLDISKLDANTIDARIEPFPVADLFQQLDLEFAPWARDKGVALRFVASSAVVLSDIDLVKNILRNLLGNALRYTSKGRILVGCRRHGFKLRILVLDTGCGIAEDAQPHIFEEFYRGAGQAQLPVQGLGLGLSIAKRLSNLLGIPLAFSSRPGAGSVFWIELPRSNDSGSTRDQGPDEPTRSPAVADLSGLCVVVVDDNPEILDATQAVLESFGCDVVIAQSTAQALTRLASARRPPDILLCDFTLGNTDLGLQAVAAIRDEFALEIPAIIITGETAAEPLARIAASGLPIMYKPLQAERLRQALGTALRFDQGKGADPDSARVA